MPEPYELDLTSAQINTALNAAHDSAGDPASGSTKLVRSGVIYDWVVGRTNHLVSAPASAGATGTVGQVAYDADYWYVCVATDTWKRVALATW